MVHISVIGHFGKGKNLLNGQTIKTKIITDGLEKRFGKDQVLKIDTHGGIKTLLKAPFHVLNSLRNTKHVIIFPAHNGLRVYAPLLQLFRFFYNTRKLHYVVIGGWLPEFISNKKLLTAALKHFDALYVETKTMKTALEAQGFNQVHVMPNCKELQILTENELVYPEHAPYKLCTFSRVMREKGIEDAINAVNSVNEILGYQAFSLDIYGQVDEDQKEWFDSLQKNFPPYVRYVGSIPFDKSTTILKNYFALLFPTYYDGEGFAGTLIDAYSAGLPVIASNWKYNTELVNEDVGFLIPTKDQSALVEILTKSIASPSILLAKKKLCLIEAEKYEVDRVIEHLLVNLQ